MVAVTPTDPVLRWAGYAQQASRKHGGIVPVPVILGLIHVESGGIEGRTSTAGAGGLTQFIGPTAAAYGVNVTPGHAYSQIDGAVRYLIALGYEKDPVHALNAYNGAQTIGGKPNPYAGNVLAAARTYGSLRIPAGSTSTTGTTSGQSTSTDTSSGLFDKKKRSEATALLLTVALVLGGAMLTYLGANQLTGGALHTAARGAAHAGRDVARVGAVAA